MWTKYALAIVAAAICFAILSPSARADCAAAKLPLDKLICGTPEIAAKDRKLKSLYQHAFKVLSPDGQQHLRDGERQWVAMMRASCAARLDQPASPVSESAEQCLSQEYDDRLEQMTWTARSVGPYLFSRIDEFAFKETPPDATGSYQGGTAYYIRSRPYIDKPVSPQTTLWNEKVKKLADSATAELISDHLANEPVDPEALMDIGDVQTYFTVGLSGTNFLSVEIDAYAYEHGFSHGWGNAATSAFLLKQNREMKLQEIFKGGSAWQTALAADCDDALKTELNADSSLHCDVFPDQDWIPTPKGPLLLVVLDAPYINVYPATPIQLTWSSLAPYLKSDLPFSIPLDH